MRPRRGRTLPGAQDIAGTLMRLAVLLEAGIAPMRAWMFAAETGDAVAGGVVVRAAEGAPLAAAIAAEGGVWRQVGQAWSIATTVGAPLAGTLRGLAAALRDAAEAADDVRIALAEPAGTARLMAWLPLVAVGLGAALGFDTFTTLLLNPIGIGCLVLGVLLIVAARRWTASLVRRAHPGEGIPGLTAELLAIALTGGVSLERARALVDAGGARRDADAEELLELSRRAGVPAVELLRASASLSRHAARVDGRLRAARLSTRLLLPLGVCTLPAFLLLGVAPMLLSVMSGVTVSL